LKLARLAFAAPFLGLLWSSLRSYIGASSFPLAVLSLVAGVLLATIALIRIHKGQNEGPKWQAIAGLAGSSGLLGLALVFSLVVVAVPRRVEKPIWREYISQAGRYSIQLPGAPVETSKKLSDDLTMYTTESQLKGDGACASFYYDYSDLTLTVTVEDLLNKSVDKLVAASEGTVVYRKAITIDNNQGVEYEAKLNEQKFGKDIRSTARIIWVNDRSSLYMQILTAPGRGELYRERFKYLDSFKVITSQEIEDKYSLMRGSSPLIDAASEGQLSRVQELLAGEASQKDKDTALMRAVVKDHLGIVESLIQAGANVNTSDQNGKTLLMLAVLHCDPCVKPIINAGADVNAQDPSRKWTPLMHSLINGHGTSAPTLVTATADLNLRDKEGETALMHAVGRSNYRDIVKSMIAAGADVNVRDNNGKSALDRAIQSAGRNSNIPELDEIVSMLKAAGATE